MQYSAVGGESCQKRRTRRLAPDWPWRSASWPAGTAAEQIGQFDGLQLAAQAGGDLLEHFAQRSPPRGHRPRCGEHGAQRTVDGLDHVQQRDVLGLAIERIAAVDAARGVQECRASPGGAGSAAGIVPACGLRRPTGCTARERRNWIEPTATSPARRMPRCERVSSPRPIRLQPAREFDLAGANHAIRAVFQSQARNQFASEESGYTSRRSTCGEEIAARTPLCPHGPVLSPMGTRVPEALSLTRGLALRGREPSANE